MNVAAKLFPAQHDDFVHDVAYDYYGKRIATCSSDEKIKVWEQDTSGGWVCKAEWKAHVGPVWKLDWSHPEFGQILASCSFDRNCYIWEEHEGDTTDGGGASGSADAGSASASASASASSSAGGSSSVRWARKAQLGDSRDSVKDIKFSPRHLGLKLATASSDGLVRVYEAVDVMNLSHWPLQDEFEADPEGASCVAWNPSRFDTPMLLVGGCSKANNLHVWGYNEDFHKWEVMKELKGHDGVIHDVAWAANVGRSYHLLASASKDGTLRIWKLTLGSTPGALKVDALPPMREHNSEVWRVQWNVTGSVLASSGDDGIVRLWKQNLRGKWLCVTECYGDTTATVDDDGSATGAAGGGAGGAAAGVGGGAGGGAGAGAGAGVATAGGASGGGLHGRHA